MSDQVLLKVEDLSVEYITNDADICVVDRVSFELRRDDIFGLAGESGSGKTTIVQAVLRLLKAPAAITGGRIIFDGQDVTAMDEHALRKFRWRGASLVMQSAMNALNPVLTIGEQIADAIEAHDGVSKKKSMNRVAELLDLVGIEGARMGSYPHELSGGMRQRVVIAMALALKPPLVIMDEPTTALDVVVQKEILKQITELKEKLGFAILFITHDLSLMLEFCSRIGILYAGRLAELAPAGELFTNPSHPYTRGLMNSFPDVRSRQDDLRGIAGTPPNMLKPPSGCRFHPRCPDVLDRCATDEPVLTTVGAEHMTACHLCER